MTYAPGLGLARSLRDPGSTVVVVPGPEVAEGPVETGREIEPVGAARVAEVAAHHRAVHLPITDDGHVGALDPAALSATLNSTLAWLVPGKLNRPSPVLAVTASSTRTGRCPR